MRHNLQVEMVHSPVLARRDANLGLALLRTFDQVRPLRNAPPPDGCSAARHELTRPEAGGCPHLFERLWSDVFSAAVLLKERHDHVSGVQNGLQRAAVGNLDAVGRQVRAGSYLERSRDEDRASNERAGGDLEVLEVPVGDGCVLVNSKREWARLTRGKKARLDGSRASRLAFFIRRFPTTYL